MWCAMLPTTMSTTGYGRHSSSGIMRIESTLKSNSPCVIVTSFPVSFLSSLHHLNFMQFTNFVATHTHTRLWLIKPRWKNVIITGYPLVDKIPLMNTFQMTLITEWKQYDESIDQSNMLIHSHRLCSGGDKANLCVNTANRLPSNVIKQISSGQWPARILAYY